MITSFKGIAAIVATSALVVGGCSGGRSVEAFCSTLEGEQARILEQLENNQTSAQNLSDQGDDLAAAFTSLAGIGVALADLATYFDRLAEVAPEEIQDDAELLAAEYDKQVDNAGTAASDPLGAIGSGLVSGFRTAGPLKRADSYARDNCGQGI